MRFSKIQSHHETLPEENQHPEHYIEELLLRQLTRVIYEDDAGAGKGDEHDREEEAEHVGHYDLVKDC